LLSQLKLLSALSSIDEELTALAKLKESELLKLNVVSDQIESLSHLAASEKELIRSTELSIREKDLVLKGTVERIKKSQAKTNVVKTNEEYKAVLKEMANEKKEKETIEEELLTLMASLEESKKNLETTEQKLMDIKSGYDDTKKTVDQKVEEISVQYDTFMVKRKEMEPQINTTVFRRYSMIKASLGSPAIVEVKDGVCQGCYMGIPPQLANNILKDQNLHNCPHCQRFLYIKDEKQE